MADKYSRAKFIDDLVSTGAFTYEEAKKHADEHERGVTTKVERPESAAISEPTAAEVQAGLGEMTAERAKQEGMTAGEKAALGVGIGVPVATGLYMLGKKSGIKDRTIGQGAEPGQGIRIEPQMDVNQQRPTEPFFEAEKPAPQTKSAALAQQFQAEYGFPLSEVEKHYQLPIKDMQEARLLGGAYKANIAPATPAGVIPSTTNMTTGMAGAQPSMGVAPPVAMPEPTVTAAPRAPVPPVIEVPVMAATESDVPASEAKKPVKPPAKTPKPKLEMPEGWGKGMSWLTQVHGTEGAQAFINEYNNGKPFATHQEMEQKYKEVTMRPKYSDIPKDVRRERGITPRAALSPVPPPSLQAAPQLGGGGGGSLIRGLTDPLQLKQ